MQVNVFKTISTFYLKDYPIFPSSYYETINMVE